MKKKLLIAGDSFAADWTIKYKGEGWVNTLCEDYDVTNVAQAGVSEYKIYNQLKTNKNINPRQLASSLILNRLLNSIYYKKNKLNKNHTYLKISFKVHSIIKDIYKILK